ncbi:MAG: nucleoside recognition domain-containing protein [Bacillota bacterium]|nr:nucleoside recognition domain-containing protein [Bacillota bacterium]
MLNLVWLLLIVSGVAVAALRGQVDVVTDAAMTSASGAVETAIALAGVMVLWLGLSRIAERSGLIEALARAMRPLLRPLFPGVPPDHPAMGAMMMNIGANLLGLGSAATPFGLRAMKELDTLNPEKGTATDAMITFLVLNTGGLSLVPAMMIGLRAQAGSKNPAEIVGATLIVSLAATLAGLAADALLRSADRRRVLPRP